MEFKNTEKFFTWLREKLEEGVAEALDQAETRIAWLNDVEEQWIKTRATDFELKEYETKSGNPEIYNYETTTKYMDRDENGNWYEVPYEDGIIGLTAIVF